MQRDDSLRGVSVLIAGAGLAGLVAADELQRHGADVLLVEGRARPGGRVWTCRDGFSANQHAEAGGDLIDEGQIEIWRLAGELGLELARILRTGWSAMRRRALDQQPDISEGWEAIERQLEPEIRAYRLAERRWDSAIAETLARESVTAWLDRVGATESMRSTAVAMRGFFLADSADLSLLALVDQFAEDVTPGQGRLYRIEGGNDRIVSALAARLAVRLRLGTALASIVHSPHGVDATLRPANGLQDQLHADYVVCTMPASTLREIHIDPPLPSAQREAIDRLRYGAATKTLLQFERAPWRRVGKGRAYGTDLPIGAVWDGNEEQPGPAGILSLLAGGSASAATRELLARDGVDGMLRELQWLGVGKTRLLAHRVIIWEDDPWARGGYAYFEAGCDPTLRPWLARPHGRILFAGEHTSMRWQGYMNGAVESGLRAAAEIVARQRGRIQPPPPRLWRPNAHETITE